MADDKQERADEAVMSSVEAGEVTVPYSIYTSKEKWIIVGMVALAGFYRYGYAHSHGCVLLEMIFMDSIV